MKPQIRNWIRDQSSGVEFDEQITEHSRIGRAGKRLVQASLVVQALTPLLVIVTTLALTALPVIAQAPTGGTIFGGNDQTLGNGVREMIKYGRNLLFLLGVGGLMWAAVNYMTEKNWTKQALGGVFCFSFGSVASIAYSFSQGNAVNLDTDLGN
jgi:hypothetical protein